MTRSPLRVEERRLVFDPFHLDVASQRLWRGNHEIPLRPKAWAILRYLVERPGQLVSKETLHREIWPDAIVSDDTLTKSIGELRRALGDDPQATRFIETVHGRGFRFMAEVRGVGGEVADPLASTESLPTDSPIPDEPDRTFVGRRRELVRLEEYFRLAARGVRQAVFITGEAGIGKTALAEEFLHSRALRDPGVHLLHGQCVQQHGQREPYMPVLDALERLLSSSAGSSLIPPFRRVAPCWYAQIPWLLSEGTPLGLDAVTMSAPPQRMLREIGTFLESMAAHSTVVLLLEDLHWSDHSTTDLLSFLAERRDPARLLLIGTYRPAEASTQDHPIREVRQTLRSHRRCTDLVLDYLSPADVREYLHRRFGDQVQALASLIHGRTDGNPLFVVAIVEELIRRGQLADAGQGWSVDTASVELSVPDDLLEMVRAQFRGLSLEIRTMLEAASVAGVSFAPWAVARALDGDFEEIEATVEEMVRSHLFLTATSREDRGAATRYEFFHALHHQVIYEQVPDGRRQRLHQRIGEALESAAGDRLAEIAPELSVHFERSRDHARAVKYLGLCMAQAQQRLAYQEAIGFGRSALGLLRSLPDGPDRDRLELEIRMPLDVSLHSRGPYDSPEVRENYEQARRLCAAVGETRQLFELVHTVWQTHVMRAELDGAQRSAAELGRIARQHHETAELRLRADLAHGRTEFWKGNFSSAAEVLTRFVDEIERQPIGPQAERYGADPALPGLGQLSFALWFLGRPDLALVQAQRGLAYAEETGHPLNRASVFVHSAILELLCRRPEAARDFAARGAELSAKNGIALFRPLGLFFHGAALSEQGDVDAGLSAMLPALAEHRAVTGPHITGLMIGMIASANARAARWDEGLRWANEGIDLTDATTERMYAAELWRIKGELLLARARAGPRKGVVGARTMETVRECFRRSLEIARAQEARTLALRSAMSLVRLSGSPEETRKARQILRLLYASFTEGFDTQDLKDAEVLLHEAKLSRSRDPHASRHGEDLPGRGRGAHSC